MPEPTAALTGLRASTAALLQSLDAARWSDHDVAAPSRCAGWSRGHLLTHLARNADGITATLSGALRHEVVPRYPDGQAGRNADIDAGADRPAAELIADVWESAQRLDRVVGALVGDPDAWDRITDEDQPAAHWIGARLREVEIHRVDLAYGYEPSAWPALLVDALLPEVMTDLSEYATIPVHVEVTTGGLAGTVWQAGEGARVEVAGPDWAVLAWATGRADAIPEVPAALTAAPPLAPWR